MTPTIEVHAPNPAARGLIAGVEFVDGIAHVERSNASALEYFRRRGYGIGGPAPVRPTEPGPVDASGRPIDSREVGTTRVGTPLQDAAHLDDGR